LYMQAAGLKSDTLSEGARPMAAKEEPDQAKNEKQLISRGRNPVFDSSFFNLTLWS
jgi:hypothetical protein